MGTLIIDVVYENGIFRPIHPVTLPKGSRARVYAPSNEEAAPSIVRTEGICGGRARIDGTRVTVWGIVAYQRSGLEDAGILEAIPTLTPEQLAAAYQYAAAHPDEIARDLAENDE